MRRALLQQWPALTKFYGLMPWHVELLTLEELGEYVRQLADHNRKQAVAASRSKQKR